MIENKFLDFEKPIAEIEARLDELNYIDDSEENISQEITKLEKQNFDVTNKIYSNLTDWQITQVSRHPMRPYSNDYLSLVFDDFIELHGDRMFSDDAAIIGGLCRLGGISIMFIGHQKGRDTKERVRRNYGMPRPEGYRKSLRLMKLAEKFDLPVTVGLIQTLIVSILSIFIGLVYETFTISNILSETYEILYAGVLSGGFAFVLQIYAQKNISPAPAAIIYSLEGVFATIAAWIILNQILNIDNILGCLFILAGVLLSQLMPEFKRLSIDKPK